MVEFVSANPTGPMHMGNARGGVLGDTLASVLTACGADVTREFYVNDAGHQIDKFAHSIEARYLQIIKGEDAVPFPEDGYQGGDIRDLAQAYYDQHGEELLNVPAAERQEKLAQFGLTFSDVADNCPRQERTFAACRRVLDFARTQPELLKRVEDTGKLPMGELSAGSGTDKKTIERHRKYLVAILLAFTNGYEIIRGHLCQVGPKRGGDEA